VNIPFAFAAGRMALPAGEYRVQKVAYDSSVLLIQRTDHAAATVVTSFAAQANAKQAQSKLLFHRYRNRYFLSQIWIAGSARQRATRCRNRSRLLPASSYPSLVPFQNEGGNPTGIRRSPFRIPVCFFICMLPPNPPNRQSLTSPERTSFFCAGQVQTTEERKDKRSNAHEQRTLT